MTKDETASVYKLLADLNDQQGALGTYFRAIPKDAIKDLFRSESLEFISIAVALVDAAVFPQLSAALQELLDETDETRLNNDGEYYSINA